MADLEAFRDTWEDGPLAKKKKQERLIGFFYYCLRLGWIKTNPAVSLGRIRADGPPTDYFPKHEFEQIIDATYIYQPKGWVECRNQATRLRILTLLMRWSGLAIRDAVTLERRRLNDTDELFLYRAKTGNPVYVPLPPDVAELLRTIPPGPSPNPRYFFWSGNGSPKSVVGNWQRSFRRLFKIVNLQREDGTAKRCHPHMLRDTFAVEMLLAGVPLEQVSILLGHKSVKITEKHYAPWVKARQQLLAAGSKEEGAMTKLLLAVVALIVTSAVGQSAFNGTWRANNQSMEYQGSNQYFLQNGIWRCDTCAPKIAIKADGHDHRVNSSPY